MIVRILLIFKIKRVICYSVNRKVNMDKRMRVLGFIDKSTDTNKYGIVSVEHYLDPTYNVRIKFMSSETTTYINEAIQLNLLLNHIAYNNNGTRHALILPSELYKGFEEELFSDQYLICYRPGIRDNYNLLSILIGQTKPDEQPLKYIKLLKPNQLVLTSKCENATLFSGLDMLKAVKTIIKTSNVITDVLVINLTRQTTWQVVGY